MNNNKGYSLTELLLAIFILSIVMLGIAGILRSTSLFYRNGVQEVRVQEEAQLAVNLIEEMLVDATYTDDDSTKPTWASGQERLIFHGEDGKEYRITYQHPTGNPQGQLLLGYFENPDDSGAYKVETLADYVTGFEVTGLTHDADSSDADNKCVVSVKMNNNGYEYVASKEVFMRNLPENSAMSISTSLSDDDDDDDDDDWNYEIELNRYDSYNLSLWYDADPTAVEAEFGDFENYFSKVVDGDELIITVDDAYNVDLDEASDNDVGIQFKTKSGDTLKVRFYFQAVSVFVSPNADIVVYSANNSMNGQGYCTIVEAKGININKCIQQSGATVKANVDLNGETHEYTLSSQNGTTNVDGGKHEFNNSTNGKMLLNVVSDAASNGLIIAACNGGDPTKYNGGKSGTMDVTVSIAPAGGQDPYTNTLNYKFRISNNVF